MLHGAASRVGGLDLGLVPGDGGLDAPAMAKAGALDLLFNLGADEIEVQPGAFVVYVGTHGDRGAHRADVILPGAAYTEKTGIYVNTEGRPQFAERAVFPPGDAREDWSILRALSDPLGARLSYDSLTQLRAALAAAHPDLVRFDAVAAADPAALVGLSAVVGSVDKAPFGASVQDFYLTNPIARASRVMAECSALARGRRLASGGIGQGMSSATPSRPRSPPWLAIAGVGAIVAAVVVVALLWLLIGGGYLDAFGSWMHTSDAGSGLRYVLEGLLLLVCLLLSTAVLIYVERKIWGSVHLRRGPNVVGPWGVLQPFADFLKFILKEPIIPASANKGVFVLAPLVSVVLAMAAWAVIPVADGWVVSDINVGILYLFAVSSLGVYGIIMAGWASNSKYPLLSALRSAAQMVSYEVSIGFVIVTVLLCAGSLNLSDIVHAQDTRFGFLGWYWLPLLPMFVIFFVSALAETNRPPFDLTEAESELVAGYAVEYSASLFLLQFLTELVAILTMSAMTTVLFLGGWLSPLPFPPFTWVPGVIWFLIKAWSVVFCFRW